MLKKLKLGLLICVLSVLILPSITQASTNYFPSEFTTAVEGGGLNTSTDLLTIIGRLINVFMSLLGMLAVILMLYGGFIWMTAQGDPEKVKKAQQIILTATVGIIVIFSAWALATFAIDYIATRAITTGTGGAS